MSPLPENARDRSGRTTALDTAIDLEEINDTLRLMQFNPLSLTPAATPTSTPTPTPTPTVTPTPILLSTSTPALIRAWIAGGALNK